MEVNIKSITRKELEKSWDLKIIVQCSSKVSVSGFIRMLRAIPVADTEIEFWDEEQLLELGTKCITAKLQEKEFAADFLWLDITTQGYRVCRADNGKCLLEI
ncbi:MAG: hypothetical protein VZR24_18260, partial [Butyrivibrio hungatei]|nr:hypothetical protein [Butyrivibrio hungatei]